MLFCELCNFDYLTIEGAMDVVSSMNAVYSCFDSLMDKFNVYKVQNFNINNKLKNLKGDASKK